MRETYWDQESRSIINLTQMRWDGEQEPGVYEVNRINTPPASRRQGFATRLVNQMLADADRENATLWLWINPSGPMGYSELADWYNRLGFRRTILLSHTKDFTGTVYVRWPSNALRPRTVRVAARV